MADKSYTPKVYRRQGGDELVVADGGKVTVEAGGAVVNPVANLNTEGGIPVVHRITAAALTGDIDVVLTEKTRVIDAWCVAVGAGAASDTITVKNGATAITDAMDLNIADKTIARATTIDDAQHEIAAGGTLRISGASAVTCEVYVLGLQVA